MEAFPFESRHRSQYIGKKFKMQKDETAPVIEYTYDGVRYDFIGGIFQLGVLITPRGGKQLLISEDYFWSKVDKSNLL